MVSILLDLAPGLKRDGNVLRQMSEKGLLRELRTASEVSTDLDRARTMSKSRDWLTDYLMLSDEKAGYFMTALQTLYGLNAQPPGPSAPQSPPQPKPAPPPVIVDSGRTGNGTWTLDSSHMLIISGPGRMANYAYGYEVPWRNHSQSIESVVIQSGVTSIGHHAFEDCLNMISVTIPDSVTFIGECAFNKCSGLASVDIPDGVTSIGRYAFDGCSILESVTIPDSVTFIGDGAFFRCMIREASVPKKAKLGVIAFDTHTEIMRR